MYKDNSKEEELNKRSWSEVDAIRNSISDGFIEAGQRINEILAMMRAANIELSEEVKTTIKGLNRDLMELAGELKAIKERHADRTGDIDDADDEDLMLSFSVFSDYHILGDRFKTVIFAPMLTLTEFMAEFTAKTAGQPPRSKERGF
jgi:hypothetical protein